MRIEDVARAVELKNDLDIAEKQLKKMERIAGFSAPTHIVFHAAGEQCMIDEDDLDGGIWFQAAEVIIKNLKDQIARYAETIAKL